MSKSILMIVIIILSINKIFKKNIFSSLGNNKYVENVVYGILAFLAIKNLFNVYYQFPFMDKTYLPFSQLKNDNAPSKTSFIVNVQVPAYSRVLYWSTQPLEIGHNESRDVNVAFGEYKNSGIATADENGNAALQLRTPASFSMGYLKGIKPVVFYRYSLANNLLSEIKTVPVTNIIKKCMENCNDKAKKNVSAPSSAPVDTDSSDKSLSDVEMVMSESVILVNDKALEKQIINIMPNPSVKIMPKAGCSSQIDYMDTEKIVNEKFENINKDIYQEHEEKDRSLLNILEDRKICSLRSGPKYENQQSLFETAYGEV